MAILTGRVTGSAPSFASMTNKTAGHGLPCMIGCSSVRLKKVRESTNETR